MGIWETTEAPNDEASETRESAGRGRFAAGTPEDVAALYTWANIQGARYRDFSGSRRRYREQVRARAGDVHSQDSEEAGLVEVNPVAHATTQASGSIDTQLESPVGSRSVAPDQSVSHSGAPSEVIWDRIRRSGSVPAAVPQPAVEADTPKSRTVTVTPASESDSGHMWASDRWERVDDSSTSGVPIRSRSGSVAPLAIERSDPEERLGSGSARAWDASYGAHLEAELTQENYAGPAWLYNRENPLRRSRSVAAVRYPAAEPLDEARERATARWSALRGVFEEGRADLRGTQLGSPGERHAPLLVLFSLAGGVGKTSLLATLGRVLSASGERVALGDTAGYSLLPFYFGARDVRPGAMRAFAPPEGSEDAPIFVANYDLSRGAESLAEQRQVVAELIRNGSECNRILLDLPVAADWLVRRMAILGAIVVVPLIPDMNSVMSLDVVERFFARMVDANGNPVLPFYLLNQYDGSLALHLDVREVLRRQLGDRLLSFVIRRSPSVSEALAEGMTVVDYAPESPVARDYFDVAAWLRTVSPPAGTGVRALRSGGR